MADDKTTVDGTLVVGGGGKLYFIPAEDLTQYELPDDLAQEAQQFLEGELADAEVSGFNFGSPNLIDIHQGFNPGVRAEVGTSLSGPIGVRDPGRFAGPNDKTVVGYVTDVG